MQEQGRRTRYRCSFDRGYPCAGKCQAACGRSSRAHKHRRTHMAPRFGRRSTWKCRRIGLRSGKSTARQPEWASSTRMARSRNQSCSCRQSQSHTHWGPNRNPIPGSHTGRWWGSRNRCCSCRSCIRSCTPSNLGRTGSDHSCRRCSRSPASSSLARQHRANMAEPSQIFLGLVAGDRRNRRCDGIGGRGQCMLGYRLRHPWTQWRRLRHGRRQ